MKFYHAVPWGMDFVCDAYQAKLMLAAMADKGNYRMLAREISRFLKQSWKNT